MSEAEGVERIDRMGGNSKSQSIRWRYLPQVQNIKILRKRKREEESLYMCV